MDSSYDVLILYASQTGNSQYLSETLFQDCFHHNITPRVLSLSNYNITELPSEKYIIFFISTTGQGEPPSSMVSFWQFLLLKDLPKDVLCEVSFTIFGLGDSVYQQFNAMARKLYQRLLQLGAKSFHERGLGDDSNPLGYYAEFEPWTDGLWKSLQKEFPEKKVILSEEEMKKLENEKEKPRYMIEFLNNDDICKLYETEGMLNNQSGNEKKKTDHQKNEGFSKTHEFSLKYNKTINDFLKKPENCVEYNNCCLKNSSKTIKLLRKHMLTTADNEQMVIQLQFETPNCLHYNTGDIACIQPQNDPELSKKLLNLLEINQESYIRIKPNPYYNSQIEMNFPEIMKIQDLFEKFLDISVFPSRYFFKILSYFTSDELHKEKLNEMGCGKKAENIEDYYNYCVKEKRNVYEILFDFKSVKLPLDYLIEALNLLKQREYSISSSLQKQNNQLSLTVALVNYKTPFGRKIDGVCSKYFKSLKPNDNVIMWLKKGSLNFPKSYTDPIIMVGPGTGISPFLSFLEERETQIDKILKENEKSIINPLKTIVIFGCRYVKKDFLYHDYLQDLANKRYITLITAFSRDQDKKIYVQHKIKENSEEITKITEENSENIRILISGNAKYMPQQVKEAFIDIFKELWQNEENAKSFINNLQKKKLFQIEAW